MEARKAPQFERPESKIESLLGAKGAAFMTSPGVVLQPDNLEKHIRYGICAELDTMNSSVPLFLIYYLSI